MSQNIKLLILDTLWLQNATKNSPESGSTEHVRLKLEELKNKYGFREPDRGDLEDLTIEWRSGKPDYTRANHEYLKGKTQNHAKGKFNFI